MKTKIFHFREMSINDWINYTFVLLAFVFPLSSKKMTIILLLLVILWIFEGKWKEKFSILNRSKVFKLYALFIGFIGISLLWSDTVYGGFVKHTTDNMIFVYFKTYFLGFLLIPIVLTSVKKKYIDFSVKAFLSAIFISEIASWLLYLNIIEIRGRMSHDPSPFMHHSLYSIFLAVTVFVLLTKFLKENNKFIKLGISLFIVSAIINLFLNGGRLGQLSFFIALCIYILLKFRVTLKTVLLSLASIFVLWSAAYQFSPIFQKRVNDAIVSIKKIEDGDFSSSWGNRVYALIIVKDIIVKNPVFGVGIGNAKHIFVNQAKEYKDGYLVEGFWHMHNQYIQILLETGIIGLLLFFFFLKVLLQMNLEKDSKLLLYIFLIIFTIGFTGESLLWHRQTFMLFNFFVAIFIYMNLFQDKNTHEILI
jgi:O-antigen ligase